MAVQPDGIKGLFQGAGWDTVMKFEIPGEMGELLVAEVEGDGFYSFAVLQAGIGLGQTHAAEAEAEGDLVVFGEMALQGAEGYAAFASEDSTFVIGHSGQ